MCGGWSPGGHPPLFIWLWILRYDYYVHSLRAHSLSVRLCTSRSPLSIAVGGGLGRSSARLLLTVDYSLSRADLRSPSAILSPRYAVLRFMIIFLPIQYWETILPPAPRPTCTHQHSRCRPPNSLRFLSPADFSIGLRSVPKTSWVSGPGRAIPPIRPAPVWPRSRLAGRFR